MLKETEPMQYTVFFENRWLAIYWSYFLHWGIRSFGEPAIKAKLSLCALCGRVGREGF